MMSRATVILLSLSLPAVLSACGPGPAGAPLPTITLEPGAARLTATIERVRAGQGPLFCDLFNAAEGFPGPSPIVGGSQEVPATAETATCTFERLPAGTYALSVIQDENANGTLDANVFGVPVEGYGVSNNVIPATEAPRFQDARLTIDGSTAMDITVRLAR